MQKLVKDFNDKKKCHKTPMPAYARLMDITSESGKLSREYLRATKYGTKELKTTSKLKMEYGGLLYSVLSLGNEMGLKADTCLNMALKEYQERMDKNETMSSEK